jgi:two-component system, chemotaxis family, CheB/CheR fusion protein
MTSAWDEKSGSDHDALCAELARVKSDLDNLMEAAGIAAVFVDREGMVTRFSPRATELLHLLPSNVGRPLADVQPRVEYPELANDVDQVLRTGAVADREVRSGEYWYLAWIHSCRSAEVSAAGAILTFVDITERKQFDDALRARDDRLSLILESAKDYAIFTLDPQRRINSWNAGAAAMLGYTEAEITGQPGDIIFTPEDRAKGDPEIEVRTAAVEGRASNERWHVRKDGSRLYCSGMVRPLRNVGGALVGFVKIMRDLTVRKQAEQALRERNDELERFNKAAVGRELQMIALKKEINALAMKAGEKPRYPVPGDS